LLVDKSKKNEQAAYQSGYAAGQKKPIIVDDDANTSTAL
jgi:hypothetical protein